MHVAQLVGALGPRAGRAAVLEALEALRRRSLVERAETPGPAAFTLQSVVLEYVTDRLVDEVSDEVTRGRPVLLVDQPLVRAQAKDYVRQTQEHLLRLRRGELRGLDLARLHLREVYLAGVDAQDTTLAGAQWRGIPAAYGTWR